MWVPKFLSADEYFTFVINQKIAIACGTLMLAGIAMLTFWYVDAYKNLKDFQSIDVVSRGRLHTFDGVAHPEDCAGLENYATGRLTITDTTVRSRENPSLSYSGSKLRPDFCARLLGEASSWSTYAHVSKTTFAEKAWWSFFLIAVTLYGWSAFGLLFSEIGRFLTGSRAVGFAFGAAVLVPYLFGMGVFLHGAWNEPAGIWATSEGYVHTTEVFITRDGRILKAPEVWFEWTKNDVLDDLTSKAGIR